MALVDYASSDDEDGDVLLASEETTAKPIASQKRKHDVLPPLPAEFHDLYASTTRISTKDDTSLHGGRKRVIPHVQGYWPTHVYIELFPSNTEQEVLTGLMSALWREDTTGAEKYHSFLTSDLGAPLPLHISLSRPIAFSTMKKDNFLWALQRGIKGSGIRPFEVTLSGLDWVANFEKNRWFLVLRVEIPKNDELNKMLHVSNTVVQQHGQSPLYIDPTPKTTPKKKRRKTDSDGMFDGMQDRSNSFHFSIAWTLKTPDADLIKATGELAKSQMKDVQKIRVKVSDIKAKIGNVVTSIPLTTNIQERNNLFGP
ncbi:U6 snRNA phosphodiesterase Usb1 [Calycina marina]|uniref:U6 snRNA phosphodiesterase n=1 Tax=Calycina marina TaxID=1763456 RepID=A0A9P8CCB3_9HELO|nr:U6 snRNA phosphodiesterase Usb1 [Calycina marina]